MTLNKIRIDNQGLLIQDGRGFIHRIFLNEEKIELICRDKSLLLKEMESNGIKVDSFQKEGFSRVIIDEDLTDYGFLNKPLRIYYGIEPRCNLSCNFCGPRDFRDRYTIATKEMETFILEEIASSGTFQVQLTGGEIGIRDIDLINTVKKISDLGLAVILSTNGVWRCPENQDEIFRALYDCGNVIQTKISIDGLPEFHDSIRGKGSYDAAVRTLSLLDQWDLHPRISATIFRESCNKESLNHLANLAKVFNAGLQPIPLRPAGRKAKDLTDRMPTREQLANYTEYATQLRKKEKIKLSFNFDIYENNKSVPIFDNQSPSSCGAPLWGVHVTHTGDVYPCGFSQDIDEGKTFLAGTISKPEDLLRIWRESNLLKQIRSAGKSDECNSCSHYSRGCWGGCWVMSWISKGKINSLDPYCILEASDD